MERLKITLKPDEFEALAQLASRETRPIEFQARHMMLEALRHERMLPREPLGPEGFIHDVRSQHDLEITPTG